MWDEQLEHYASIFVACRFEETGMTFERFLRNPMKAIAALGDTPAVRQWARSRSVSATALAKHVGGAPTSSAANEDRRAAGIEEHARHHRAVQRFMATSV